VAIGYILINQRIHRGIILLMGNLFYLTIRWSRIANTNGAQNRNLLNSALFTK